MSRFQHAAVAFLTREDGPTAVEYAIMLAFICIVCVAAVSSLGTNTNASFAKANAGFTAS